MPAKLGADTAQTLETIAGDFAQTNAGIGEFYATPVLDEQSQPELFLELTNLPADRPVGHAQLVGRCAHATEAGGGFEGAQGIEGREVAAHGVLFVSFPDKSWRSYRFSRQTRRLILDSLLYLSL
ncbi:hypothetical protein D3C78_1358920 [compost metagenome]